MVFHATEKAALLTVKGGGEKVILHLEQMGIDSLAKLTQANPQDITEQVDSLVGSSCWKNSPKPRKAISNAIEYACQQNDTKLC
jgi:nucleotidyltransferase/DNA polymerase involved in DNA repair